MVEKNKSSMAYHWHHSDWESTHQGWNTPNANSNFNYASVVSHK